MHFHQSVRTIVQLFLISHFSDVITAETSVTTEQIQSADEEKVPIKRLADTFLVKHYFKDN